MVKATAYLMVILVLACAVPALAQGPFTDVPADHWAYDAVNQLQQDGILIGYPDGTFGGKRNITRFEFAAAVARLMGIIPPVAGQPNEPKGLVTQQQLKDAIAAIPKVDLTPYATKADVDAIKRLVDEFRDEIAALGVDVDALKRDVAALGARVDAIEAELKRVKWYGDVSGFAIAGATTGGQNTAIDLDQRMLNPGLMQNISVVKDFDLKVVGRISDCVTANATINYGNYLNYLGFVDDYVDSFRPTANTANQIGPAGGTLSDTFFPYYLSVDAGIGKGALTVGRFPLQFTPYTLKMIDVDSYTTNMKTDSGNYPVDGVKLAINLWGVDWTWFAAKNNENDFLARGLTGQPRAGLYDVVGNLVRVAPFHQIAVGNAVGGLTQVTQSAGVRAVASLPASAIVGVTYYQAWDKTGYAVAGGYDQARVYGADLAVPIPWVETLNFAGSWTRCDTIVNTAAPGAFSDVDYKNVAWDGKFSGNVSKLGIGAGYKNIGRNFAAAGFWDKIGRWSNPTNIKGPYLDLNYPVLDNLKVNVNGELMTASDDVAPVMYKDDEVIKAEAAVKYGFCKSTSVDVSYQYVKWNPKAAVGVLPFSQNSTENYITLGIGHQINPNAGVKLGYQMLSLNGSSSSRPYFANYRGGLGVVQFGVSF